MPGFELSVCLNRLAERNPGKTEADVQADVRDVLLYAGFDLGDEQVRLEAPAEDRKRIDVEVGAVVIECKRDLRIGKVRSEAEAQLAGYLRGRQTGGGRLYAGVLTDGTEWRYYLASDDGLRSVSNLLLRTDEGGQRDFRLWLGAILATEHELTPTSASIDERLGADSPACLLLLSELRDLWRQASSLPAGRLKRELWGKLLRTALGTQFGDNDELFVEHTYLVLVATLIAHALVGFDIVAPAFSPAVALSGQLFAQAGLEGVGEAGFFDWVLEVPGGAVIVADLARRVACFEWQGADHDVLKALYESVISPDDRHSLGEYYTPDWLAERMVAEVIDDALNQRVLDPACGSGTFVFHAVRRYLDAADAAGRTLPAALTGVTESVFGLDLHPVAVVLAQVTYLLAIGRERLAERTGPLTVPVYLGDSMRWEQQEESLLAQEGEVVVPISGGLQLFGSELRFPASVATNTSRFDQLVETLAARASSRASGAPRLPIAGVLSRFAFAEADRPVLDATYQLMCDLHDDGRNHIWSFYVRNQARPTWFAVPTRRVDVLVGNPPWLAYRFMPEPLQRVFERRAKERRIWVGGARGRTTQQDLSAFFVARSIELYLRVEGRFAFVMPLATLSRQQYEGFRKGDFSSATETCAVAFDVPWDLERVKPDPFPVPCAVVLGRRVATTKKGAQRPMPGQRAYWSGRPLAHGGWDAMKGRLTITEGTTLSTPVAVDDRSAYTKRFRAGATIFPRMLTFVVDEPRGGVGVPKGRRAVRSRRGVLDKKPWKSLPDLTGVVEDIFVRPAYLGEHVLPFRLLSAAEAVIPYDGNRLMSGEDERLDRYPGLADWWRAAEAAFMAHRVSDKRTLIQQLDYMKQLTAQFPIAPVRVVYSASGNTLAAAVVTDSRAVIEHKLYWGAAADLDEARYLTAVLNAPVFTKLVRPYQSVGAFGPRDFDKYVWYAPVPEFDPNDVRHRHLVDLAEGLGFQQARKLVRQALENLGTAQAIDAEFRALLGIS